MKGLFSLFEFQFFFFFVVFSSTSTRRQQQQHSHGLFNMNIAAAVESRSTSTTAHSTISRHNHNIMHNKKSTSSSTSSSSTSGTSNNITLEVQVSITRHFREPTECKNKRTNYGNENEIVNYYMNMDTHKHKEKWAITVYTIEDVMTDRPIKSDKDYPFHETQYFLPFDSLSSTRSNNSSSSNSKSKSKSSGYYGSSRSPISNNSNSNSNSDGANTTLNGREIQMKIDEMIMKGQLSLETKLHFYIPRQKERKKDRNENDIQKSEPEPEPEPEPLQHLQQQLSHQYERFLNRDKFYRDPQQIIFIQLSKFVPYQSKSKSRSNSTTPKKNHRMTIISRTVRKVTTKETTSSSNPSSIVVKFNQEESVRLKGCYGSSDNNSIHISNNNSTNGNNSSSYDENNTTEQPIGTTNQVLAASKSDIIRSQSQSQFVEGEGDTSTTNINKNTALPLLLRIWILLLSLLSVILFSYIFYQNWDLAIDVFLKRQSLGRSRYSDEDGRNTSEVNGGKVKVTSEKVKRESDNPNINSSNRNTTTSTHYNHTSSTRRAAFSIIIVDDSDDESDQEEKEAGNNNSIIPFAQDNVEINMTVPPILQRRLSPDLFTSPAFDSQYGHQGYSASTSCSNTSMFVDNTTTAPQSQNEAVQENLNRNVLMFQAGPNISQLTVTESKGGGGCSVLVHQRCIPDKVGACESFQSLNGEECNTKKNLNPPADAINVPPSITGDSDQVDEGETHSRVQNLGESINETQMNKASGSTYNDFRSEKSLSRQCVATSFDGKALNEEIDDQNHHSEKLNGGKKDLADDSEILQSLSNTNVTSDSNSCAFNDAQDDMEHGDRDVDNNLVCSTQNDIIDQEAAGAGSISSLGSKQNIRELHQDTPDSFESNSSKELSHPIDKGSTLKRKHSRLSITKTRQLKQMIVSNNHTNNNASDGEKGDSSNVVAGELLGPCQNGKNENEDCHKSGVDIENALDNPNSNSDLNHDHNSRNIEQKVNSTKAAKYTNGGSHENNTSQEKKLLFSNGKKKQFIPPPPAPKFVPSSELLSASKAVESPVWEFSSSISPTANRSTDDEYGQDSEKKKSQSSSISNRRRTRSSSRTRSSRINRFLSSTFSKRRDHIPRTIVVASTVGGDDDGSSIHADTNVKNCERPNKRKRNVGTEDSTSSNSSSSKRSRCY